MDNLNAIWGSAANEVWLVGGSGLIRRWDGAAWTTLASGSTVNLFGVWGSSATDLWAVGAGGTILRGP
jgi:hypothetical protein